MAFDRFKKHTDYSTRYLQSKLHNESRVNEQEVLWSGRPGRWDGVVFNPARTPNSKVEETEAEKISEAQLRGLSDHSLSDYRCVSSQKSPWRQPPDIAPRPAKFNSAAEEKAYLREREKQRFSPSPTKRRSSSRSPTSYLELSRDDAYLSSVLSQRMGRPEWKKFYKPSDLSSKNIFSTSKKDAIDVTKRNILAKRDIFSVPQNSWMSDSRPMYMGGSSPPPGNGSFTPRGFMPAESFAGGEYYDNSGYDLEEEGFQGDRGPMSPDRDGSRGDESPSQSWPLVPPIHETSPQHSRRGTESVNSNEIKSTLQQIMDHKREMLKKLRDARDLRP